MRFQRLAALLLLPLFLLPGSACEKAPADGALPQLEDMNVLLIVIDTMGAAHTGSFTPGLETTPNMDALADGGILFREAVAPSPWTQPSIASLLTGLTPSGHGAIHLFDKLGEDNVTLAELLKQRGFRTSGIISHLLVEDKLGYGQGFESYDNSAVAGHRGISSPRVTKLAIEELRELEQERFFLFLHYFDPHYQYLHHSDYDRTAGYDGPLLGSDAKIGEIRENRFDLQESDIAHLRNLYHEEIEFTDHYVGLVLDELDALGLRENTLVILAADHGEEFMEHDWIGHTRYLYDTLTHVPLIFSLPGRIVPRKIDAPVSLVDVVPTVLGLSSERADVRWDGIPLPLSPDTDIEDDRDLFSEVAFLSPPEEQGTREAEKEAFLAAISRGRWKLIHDLDTGAWALFDRQTDPAELNDLYSEDHAVVKDLKPRLISWEEGKTESWGRDFGAMEGMTEAEREQLRSLGYVR